MKQFLRILYMLTLGLLFLPAFAFPLGERSFRIYFIFLLAFFGLFIILNFQSFVKKLIFLFKNTTFRYLIYFIAYLFISAVILCVFKLSEGVHSIVYLLQLVFLYVIPSFLLSAYFISHKLKLKNYIKFYFIALFCIFIFGLIEFFFGKVLHIEFVNAIQRFLANERNLEALNVDRYAGRLASVFAEPGWLGGFIFLNFPIIYKCCLSKFKIFKHKSLNTVIKKFMIPLAWSNILLTMSPIWLVLCFLQAMVVFRKFVVKILFSLKTLIFLIISLLLGFLLLLVLLTVPENSIEISQIMRITEVLGNVFDFEAFLEAEPSLGSRIVSYYAQIKIFLSHFLIGTGLGNSKYYAADAIIKYNIPMTVENFVEFEKSGRTGQMHINTSALYTLLAETGIVGTFLYYLFIVKSADMVKKITLNTDFSLIRDFGDGLGISLFLYIFMTFYDTMLTVPYNWFFFGLACALYVNFLHEQQKLSEIKSEQNKN